MSGLRLGKSIQWAPVGHVLVMTVGTMLSFIIAYVKGDVSLYLPFISETGAYSPEKSIFSLGLIIGSLLGMIVVIFRFIGLSQNVLNEDRKFAWLNNGSFLAGIFAMFGVAGVAAFPMTTVFWAHLLAAIIYFVGSAVYFTCATILTYKMNRNSGVYVLRFVLSVAIWIFLFLLMICFPVSFTHWHNHNEIIPALKEPSNEGFTMMLISSIMEWATVAVIITFNLSFVVDSKNRFVIKVVTEDEPGQETTAAGEPQSSAESML